MSDFLSNFTSDKYKKDAEEQELVTPDTEIPETAMENVTPDLSEVANYDAVSDDDVLADTTIRGLSCEMLDEETNAEDFNEITVLKPKGLLSVRVHLMSLSHCLAQSLFKSVMVTKNN